jgi:putative lipoic acid-binding regulatory protein
MPEPSLIEYPLDFPVKIMGKNEPGFVNAIVEIVRRHAPDFNAESVELRRSKIGR